MSTGEVATDPPSAHERPFQRIGRYDVFPAFARGGMASVHLGRATGDSGFARVVAIKRLHPLYAESEAHFRMLREEARILSRIKHANVIPLLDVVQAGGELCLVMDYVAGVSLADLAREAAALGTRLPAAVAVAVVTDALRGLHAAHDARGEDGAALEVVHRDVSPHNLLVGADGVTRVLDFGIAKALRTEQLTHSADLRGKLTFMAPEQLRGARATRQSDVFSAGVTLWEALTGRKLFGEEAGVAPSALALTQPAPRPSQWAPDVPPPLDAAVGRALALDPRDRFESAEEMALALEDACPPAPRETVRAEVERLAADELERRAAAVRAVELLSANEPALTPRESATPSPAKGRPSRASSRVALLLTLLLLGSVTVFTCRVGRQEVRRGAAPPASPAPALPTASVSASSFPVAPGEVDASTPADAAPREASADAAPRASSPQRPPLEGAKKARDCTPPFRIDEAGVKIYKPECL